MPDMLVKLYTLPEQHTLLDALKAEGIIVRRSIAPEKHVVTAWVGEAFSAFWRSETEVAYSNRPASVFVATHAGNPIGFGCYDTTQRGFFGPTGVDERYRGKRIGKALLLACLHDMRAQGYGYAVIGGAGPTEFYAGAVGATVIPESWPGVYEGLLRGPDDEPDDDA